jgi:nicotinamidase-related amidase
VINRLYIGVDLQEGFLSDRIRGTDYIEKVAGYVNQLDKNVVVLTRFVNHPNSNFEKLMDWPKMRTNDADTRLFGDLEKQRFTVIAKPTYTSWTPEIHAKAQELQADEVVIFGLDSHACVLKTALDVFDAGLTPIVLSDLCESSDGTDRDQTGLDLIASLIGVRQVMTSAQLAKD